MTLANLSFQLTDTLATEGLGARLAELLRSGGVVFLEGTLGAGKTTLTRGLLHRLGHEGAVKSPTYTLVELYEVGSRTVYHFDLYRLAHPQELDYMGVRDYFDEQAVCLIEWPSRGAGFLPRATLGVTLTVAAPGRRLAAAGPGGAPLRIHRRRNIPYARVAGRTRGPVAVCAAAKTTTKTP